MTISRRIPRIVIALLLTLSAAAVHAAQVGEAVFARGAASASRGGEVVLLGNGSPLFEGDVVTTAERSFALLKFNDGTRVSLRPDTVFQVERFAHGAGEESTLLSLFRGGMRAVTGLISRRNPDGFRVRTPIATVGIRGTDFTARLCEADCAREATRHASGAGAPTTQVAGRIAFVRGPLRASGGGSERALVTGGSVFEGDVLETGANTVAVIAFRDQGRVTLQPNSRFSIDRYSFDANAPQSGSSVFSLLRGGLRAVTGLVGRSAPRAYRMNTPIATIGIRGTSFDLVCQGDCARDGAASLDGPDSEPDSLLTRAFARLLALVPEAYAQQPAAGPGLFVFSRGELDVTPIGQAPLSLGPQQNLFVPGGPGQPIRNPVIPQSIRTLLGNVPLPESVPVPPGFFQTESIEGAPPGLYLSVRDNGHATVETPDGQRLDVSQDETVLVGQDRPPSRLEGGTPPFIAQDPYNQIDPRIDPASTPVPDPDRAPLECRV